MRISQFDPYRRKTDAGRLYGVCDFSTSAARNLSLVAHPGDFSLFADYASSGKVSPEFHHRQRPFYIRGCAPFFDEAGRLIEKSPQRR